MKVRYCGNLHCTNTVGSFICDCYNGFTTEDHSCVDIDECEMKTVCPKNSVCRNSDGDYSCMCDSGYTGDICEDIDECSGKLSKCDINSECKNTIGSFSCTCHEGYYGNGKDCYKGQCDDKICSTNEECVSATSMVCKCKEGFLKSADVCVDVNECLLTNNCDVNSKCTNSAGGYICNCNDGFYGNGTFCSEGTCTNKMCGLNEQCVSPTNDKCKCKNGFERHNSGVCVDIDECLANICDENADCVNFFGSYKCTCKEGYFGNGRFCARGQCSSEACPAKGQECVSPRGIDCKCGKGWIDQGKNNCVDVDECQAAHNCDKHAKCVNTNGSYDCVCKPRFTAIGTKCVCEKGFHFDNLGMVTLEMQLRISAMLIPYISEPTGARRSVLTLVL